MSQAAQAKVVCFLDADGVLHGSDESEFDEVTSKVLGEHLFCWWPHLRAVLDEHPDVEVVMHSSWRHLYSSLDRLRQELPPDLASRVAAVTDVDVYSRYESIEAYLRKHPEVTGYVVVDDTRNFPAHVPLVLCDSQRGMSDPKKANELHLALIAAKEGTGKE